jgi:hypothetical protein
VILKLLAGRPKDLLDAQEILNTHREQFDRGYVEQWADRLGCQANWQRIPH